MAVRHMMDNLPDGPVPVQRVGLHRGLVGRFLGHSTLPRMDRGGTARTLHPLVAAIPAISLAPLSTIRFPATWSEEPLFDLEKRPQALEVHQKQVLSGPMLHPLTWDITCFLLPLFIAVLALLSGRLFHRLRNSAASASGWPLLALFSLAVSSCSPARFRLISIVCCFVSAARRSSSVWSPSSCSGSCGECRADPFVRSTWFCSYLSQYRF